MALSEVNQARREIEKLRGMIDEARRDLGIETAEPTQIAVKRTSRRSLSTRRAERPAGKSSAA
jgi:hypothetical protein